MAIPLIAAAIPFLTDLISKYGEKLVVSGVEKITGVDLGKTELTPEDKQLIIDAEYKIKALDFETLKETHRASEAVVSEINSNTKNAREMNVSIQTSAEASPLAKNIAYIIDIVIVSATVILAFFLFIIPLPLDNKELAYMMFGSLLTLSGNIINFYRGSSPSTIASVDGINKLSKLK